MNRPLPAVARNAVLRADAQSRRAQISPVQAPQPRRHELRHMAKLADMHLRHVPQDSVNIDAALLLMQEVLSLTGIPALAADVAPEKYEEDLDRTYAVGHPARLALEAAYLQRNASSDATVPVDWPVVQRTIKKINAASRDVPQNAAALLEQLAADGRLLEQELAVLRDALQERTGRR